MVERAWVEFGSRQARRAREWRAVRRIGAQETRARAGRLAPSTLREQLVDKVCMYTTFERESERMDGACLYSQECERGVSFSRSHKVWELTGRWWVRLRIFSVCVYVFV